MFQVVADVGKNRLYLTLGGHFSSEERRRIAESITQEVAKLRPGFDLINDISQAHPTDEWGLKELMRVQRFLRSLGLRRVVRVTKMLLTELQVERVSKQTGCHSIIMPSLEKAEKLLDSCEADEDSGGARGWDQVRKYRRISVGPDHTIQFSLGPLELKGVRITNLSAEGCFAVVQDNLGDLLREGVQLRDLCLGHEDLPYTRVPARVVHIVRGLAELTDRDIGLGIQFLSTSEQFIEWVDAYVMAHYGLHHGLA